MTAGWPRDLVPHTHPDFAAAASAWLLDRSPPEWRTSPLREDPVALAWAVGHYVAGAQEGTRRAYREARVRLDPADVIRVQAALEAYGAHLLTVAREVALVHRALERAAT